MAGLLEGQEARGHMPSRARVHVGRQVSSDARHYEESLSPAAFLGYMWMLTVWPTPQQTEPETSMTSGENGREFSVLVPPSLCQNGHLKILTGHSHTPDTTRNDTVTGKHGRPQVPAWPDPGHPPKHDLQPRQAD